MINTDLLKSRIILNGLSTKQVSHYLGISNRAFKLKLAQKSVFYTDEIDKLCTILKIESYNDRIDIFLACRPKTGVS